MFMHERTFLTSENNETIGDPIVLVIFLKLHMAMVSQFGAQFKQLSLLFCCVGSCNCLHYHLWCFFWEGGGEFSFVELHFDCGNAILINCLQNLQNSQKQEAAKHCSCTIADVENTLAKFVWAKEAQKKLQKLKEEGKPMPKTMAEVVFHSV